MRLTVFRNLASAEIRDDITLEELKKIVPELLGKLGKEEGNIVGIIIGID